MKDALGFDVVEEPSRDPLGFEVVGGQRDALGFEVIATDLPDEFGIGQEVRAVGRAVKRGALAADQGLTTLGVNINLANAGAAADEWNAAQRALEDFDRQAAANPAFAQAGQRWRQQQVSKLAELSAEVDRRLPQIKVAFPRIARRETQIQALPPSPDLANLRTDFWATLASNPVETIATVVAESLPQMAPGLVGAAAGGGPLAVGANSFGVEYANALLDTARTAGADLTDPAQVEAFFRDPQKLNAARQRGVLRGLPVAAFDAASAGLAGRFLQPALGTGARNVAVASAKELGMQAGLGMGGETAGQLAADRRITSVPDIVLEGIAELGSGPAEVFGNVRGEMSRPTGAPPNPPSAIRNQQSVDPAVDELPDYREARGAGSREQGAPSFQTVLPTDVGLPNDATLEGGVTRAQERFQERRQTLLVPTLTDAGLSDVQAGEGFTPVDLAVATGRRTVRPLDPLTNLEAGLAENVPAEGIDVVSMGRRVEPKAAEAPKGGAIPELPTVLAEAIAAENRPDVFVEHAVDMFGESERGSAESMKPSAEQQRVLAQARQMAAQRGWDWNAVQDMARQQLGLDANFLKPESRAAKVWEALQERRAELERRRKRTDESLGLTPDKTNTPQEKFPGTRSVAQRTVNAEERFLEFAMQTAGLTREQATAALAEYRKAKAIKFDPVGGQWTFTHGGFAEADVLRRAAGVASATPAPAARTANLNVPPDAGLADAIKPARERSPVDEFVRGVLREQVEQRKADTAARRDFDLLAVEIAPEMGWVDNLDALAHTMQAVKHDATTITAKIARAAEVQKVRHRALQALGVADPKALSEKERAAYLPKLKEFAKRMRNQPERQAEDLAQSIQPDTGKRPVNTGELSVGDRLNIDGEPVLVEAVDPDTGDVTLKDGTRFGRNTIADGQTIYVEEWKPTEQAAEFAPEATNNEGAKGPSDSAIRNPQSAILDAPESVADQKARLAREEAQAKTKADREKLAELQAKPLTGSVGDIGQGDLLGGGDLFSAPAPKAKMEISSDQRRQLNVRLQQVRQSLKFLNTKYQPGTFGHGPVNHGNVEERRAELQAEAADLERQLGRSPTAINQSITTPIDTKASVVDTAIAALESLKVDTAGKVFDAIQGIPVLVWNGALNAAQLAIRAGQRVAQAIDAALAHIRANHRAAFDEPAVRAELEKSLGQRQFAEQIDAAPDVAQPVKDATTNRFYTRKPNEDTAAFAGRIIAGVGGPQNAVAVFTDTTNGLGGAERTMLGQLIVKQLSAAGQHEAAARFLDDTFLPYSTEAAQALQAFAAFANLTPEGALIYAKRLFNRTQRQPRERIQPGLDSAVDTLADINQQGIASTVTDPQVQSAAGDLVTDAVLADGTKPGSGVRKAILVESANGMRKRILQYRGVEAPRTMLAKLTGRDGYWKTLVGGQQKALTGALLKALGLKPTDQLVTGTVSQLAGDLGRILRQQMDAVLAKPGQPVTPRSARSQLLTLLANSERLSEVWAGVRTQLEAEGKTDPNVIRMLNTTVDVWSKPLLASVAREYLKTADVTLTELVRNHYIEVAEGRPSPTLTAKIVDWLGVTPEEAKPLAQAFDTVLREEAEKIRKGLRNRVNAVKRDPRWKRVLASGLAGPEAMSDVDVDAAIAQAIREQRVNLGRLVREHYRTVNATGRSLADAVAATAGVKPDVAARFAAVLEARFAERVKVAKAAAIGRLEQAVAVPREVKQVWQRLVELSNLGALDRETAWNAVAEKLKLPQWTPAIAKEVTARAEAIAKTPEGIFRQRRIVELHNYLAKQTGVPVMDKVLAFWYANTLSGPTTQAVNLLANVQNLTANLLVAARSPRDFTAQLAAVGRGLQQGGREAADVLRTGILTRPGNTKLAASRPLELLTLPGRWDYLLTPFRLVGRTLAAGDSLFFHAGQESRAVLLARQLARSEGLSGDALQRRVAETLGRTSRQRFRAVRQAMREGLSGQDLARRVDDLTQQQRPEGLNENARDYALRLTFNQKPYGMLGGVATMINYGGSLPVVGLPLRLVVPFTNVVANVANEALNYVPPIGVARAAWGHWKGTLEGQPITDRNALGDQWGKAALGTVLLGAVWGAAEAGLDDDDPWFMVNGAGPREFNKKNQLRAGGWIPFSLKIGDRYVSYSNSPAAMALAAVGNYFDARRYRQLDEQDAWNRLAYAFTTMGKVILEQSFLDGIARIVGALDRDNVNAGKQLAQSIGRTAGNFVIPNAVRQVDRIFDPTVYDAATTEAALVNSVPFARRLNRPALNVWGEPVRNEVSKRFGSSTSPDPLLQLLARRQLWVSAPSSTQTEHRNGQPMTPDEFYEFTRHRGQILRTLLQSEGMQRTLETAPQETVERIWRRLQTQATERAKSKVARR